MEIFINQEGYLPSEEKYFILSEKRESFKVIDSTTNEMVYSGDIQSYKKSDKATGEDLFIGYFSDLSDKGNYYIETEKSEKSYNFNINDDVFNSVRDKALKSYYYQRSGINLEEKYAGIFAREAGHTYNLKYHPSSPIEGEKDVTGGWYDAGDYGRYIIPASVSLAVMLMGYEQFPEKLASQSVGIPESGNGIPDFLNEMKFELQWMLKMQHRGDDKFKGALPYMVNSYHRVDGMPAKATGEQFIYDFSSIATGDFAAVMAMSSRIYKGVDRDFASRCLEASKLAWSFLENSGPYPEGGFQRPEDTTTGGYAEHAKDNKVDFNSRLWAALELFLVTEDVKYHDYFKGDYKKLNSQWEMAWTDVTGFVKLQYILGDAKLLDKSIQEGFKKKFLSYCDKKLMKKVDRDGFNLTISPKEYIWGSNGELLNRAEQLIFAYQITNNKKYYNGALAQLNYVLGLNIHGTSFVAYTGTKFPKLIHHMIGFETEFKDAIPGLIAGGPNSGIEGDETLPLYFNKKTPPAKCYIDHRDSWASNESCILYNAPLVPVAAYFSSSK